MSLSEENVRALLEEAFRTIGWDMPESTPDAFIKLIDALDGTDYEGLEAIGDVLCKVSPEDLKALGLDIPLTKCSRCNAILPDGKIIHCCICKKVLACPVCNEDAMDQGELNLCESCNKYACNDHIIDANYFVDEFMSIMVCLDCLSPEDKRKLDLEKRPKETIDEAMKNKETTCMTCKFWDLETLDIGSCTCNHPDREEEVTQMADSCENWEGRDGL